MQKRYINPFLLKIESLIEHCEHVLAKSKAMGPREDVKEEEKRLACESKLISLKKKLQSQKRLEPQVLTYDPYSDIDEDEDEDESEW
jgi:hypothetical protein